MKRKKHRLLLSVWEAFPCKRITHKKATEMPNPTKNKNPFLIVSGSTGTGKTTLSRFLSSVFGYKVLRSTVEDFYYLNEFVADKAKWGFHNQIQFIIHYKRQQQIAYNIAEFYPVCLERSVYECYEVFTRNLFINGSMSDRDFNCLTAVYEEIYPSIVHPDLIIYLEALPVTLHKRIVTRARSLDHDVTCSSLSDMNSLFDRWIGNLTLCPVLRINTDEYDLTDKSAQQYLVAQITDILPNVKLMGI
jgi:hypothetical protein